MDDSVGMNCTFPVANPSSRDPGIISDSVSGVHDLINSAPYATHAGASDASELANATSRAFPLAAREHLHTQYMA